jgi:(E)-4-hydroxy-3-methylbut-2-enyl-diphosphate synthase
VAERRFDKNLNVALMGCAVNGPGEAAGADLGVSLGRGRAHLFKRGKVVRTVPEGEIVDAVLEAIETWEEDDDEAADDDAPVAPAAASDGDATAVAG